MKWDYIIVGAGSAGCTLAHELLRSGSEAAVLLLEAGGGDRPLSVRIPAGQLRAVARYDWGYRSAPDPTRDGTVENWLRGRILGGSSSINGTVFVRGAAEDFDRWANGPGADLASWSASKVLPIFRELETSDQPGPLRGRTGPLHVRTVRQPHELTAAFVGSANAGGYPFNEDYNGGSQGGVGYAQLTQRRGVRCSAADAFLRPCKADQRLTVITGATVERIDVSHGRAVGIHFSHGGKSRTESARDVILCAGAIATPKLLMLSGIGDPDELRRHGIGTSIALPAVGRHLREHPLIRLTYRTRIPSYNVTQGLRQKIEIVAKYLRHGEGPLSNLFEAVAFLGSTPGDSDRDIQLHFTPVGYLERPGGALELATFPSATVLVNKSHPESVGRVRLSSGRAHDPPAIEPRILERESDLDSLVDGIGTVREIMREQPIAALVEQEIAPGSDITGARALKRYVRAHTTLAFHGAGTCRMGTSEDAVVEPTLRVRGTENLWIADASVMPDLISGNTNAVCMMIGMKLGKYLTARHG